MARTPAHMFSHGGNDTAIGRFGGMGKMPGNIAQNGHFVKL
jgi:hypothetical protein